MSMIFRAARIGFYLTVISMNFYMLRMVLTEVRGVRESIDAMPKITFQNA